MDRSQKEMYKVLAAMGTMSKQEVIRINISSTFLAKARCKECGKGPDYYYASMQPFKWEKVKYFILYSKFSQKWVKRMASDWYQAFQPRYFRKLGDFSFALEGKSYDPILHRVKGANIRDKDNIVEYVGCSCGATVWSFNDKSTNKRPEITNRKGRYKYPQKFVY
jgi:hypothetical protein